ncbi:hypothetical protein BRADI_1g73510v3 [Brachypodium distachyon]|uniref:Uncharacterized protein n=1 Tax=Brachypodium distachyon TaxID=15368 RepID=A0A2K2DUZ7_BRADI|nr:hypothetical protein BRADI_1g73510v3 [Brachypodium distachyon]
MKTEESPSRSHERLLRRDDYITYVNSYFAYDDYIVYDYLDYFLYIATPHVSESAIPTTTTTLVFFFQDSCSIPGNKQPFLDHIAYTYCLSLNLPISYDNPSPTESSCSTHQGTLPKR